MPTSNYLACTICAESRAQGRFDSAKSCHQCNGYGFYREYTCNSCADPTPIPRGQGIRGLVVSGGYDSQHLTDCTTYEFSVCEKCVRGLFGIFKEPPALDGYLGNAAGTYAKDLEYYKFSQWKKAGGQKEKLLTGICNATEECQNPAIWRHFTSSILKEESVCDEHKDGFSNSLFVLVKDIDEALRQDPQDLASKTKICQAWLKEEVHPGRVMTYFKYLPSLVARLLDVDQNITSGLFLPSPSEEFEENLPAQIALPFWKFQGLGKLYHGSLHQVKEVMDLFPRNLVLPVQLLRFPKDQ